MDDAEITEKISRMSVSEFVKKATRADLILELGRLSKLNTEESLSRLRDFLLYPDVDQFDKMIVSRVVSVYLLMRGNAGLRALAEVLNDDVSIAYQIGILETLWCAAKREIPSTVSGQWPSHQLPKASELFPPEITFGAAATFSDFCVEAIEDGNKYLALVQLLMQLAVRADDRTPADRADLMEAIAQGTIRLTRRLIEELEHLIAREAAEAVYQEFLSKHPVFLDPLAAEIISRQRLGLEHEIDYVVRRYDGRYLGVEIEKPQDALFTDSNDFRAGFTHAFGQVLDFQRWVDTHAEYARHLLPGISVPRGLVVMGIRAGLSEQNISKLNWFNANSSHIEVVTFDDLVVRAKDLYSNIRRWPRYAD